MIILNKQKYKQNDNTKRLVRPVASEIDFTIWQKISYYNGDYKFNKIFHDWLDYDIEGYYMWITWTDYYYFNNKTDLINFILKWV